jgi:hypothetical protein
VGGGVREGGEEIHKKTTHIALQVSKMGVRAGGVVRHVASGGRVHGEGMRKG